mgnify:FL=1
MVSLLTGFLFFGVSRIAYCPLNDKYFQKGDFGEPGHILCFPFRADMDFRRSAVF